MKCKNARENSGSTHLTPWHRDLEGQIQRCRERINTGVMVKYFELRMDFLMGKQEYRNRMIACEPPGLGFEVVQRLDCLKRIKRDHERVGDRYEQLPNVRALIDAYRSGQLEWSSEGRVTFWSKGHQIGEPRQFDWGEFEKVAGENDGQKSFWVEGVSEPSPRISFGPLHLLLDLDF